jgi:pimeloyl-ACP methyl ester carboxylesterase
MADVVTNYFVDAWQRSILFLDVMRQRSEQAHVQAAKTAPHVLQFAFELLIDGRSLKRPVNYGLIRILPRANEPTDERKPPFVIIDPRAGHGPGIGGFKADSEIGVALKAGHPCYFIGFTPEPMPGQTIEDVLHAEIGFIEHVVARHPDADGKPVVVGNCQAGWAVAMLAAARPDLCGPILLAGAPLSYWAGVHGKNPMRYSGGLFGGSWLTALTSDLGNGRFDGAWLISNFEGLDLANTLWTKQYNLYSRIDTEPPRYLEFERWWGTPVTLNAEEIQFIVDKLFVGNLLSTGKLTLSDGTRLDLRRIRSPIVVFCSQGDNITPPQQALGWILDLYDSVDDIRCHGQTIVYSVHDSIGHLGIFVSGKVAKKEHDEFASNMDFIDLLPPGLYEAVLAPVETGADTSLGRFVLRFEHRTLDDIRALGGNDLADERRFAAVANLSEINLGLYRTFISPWVRAGVTADSAGAFQALHPARLATAMFSSANPFMGFVAQMAEQVRANRQAVPPDNPLLAAEKKMAEQIESGLDNIREARDAAQERLFLAVYGSPLMQAMVGLGASDGPPRERPAQDPVHAALVAEKIASLRAAITDGGTQAATIRALLYVGMPGASADERSFAVIRKVRQANAEHRQMTLAAFKQLVRDQFFTLLLEPVAAVAAIPKMLPPDADLRRKILDQIRTCIEARGEMLPEVAERFREITRLFALPDDIGEQHRRAG